jgi:hypothetical protein
VRLIKGVPLVHVDEEVLWQFESDGDEMEQRVEDFVVQILRETLDFFLLLFQKLGDGLRDVAIGG